VVSRLWAQACLSATSTVAVGFATTFLAVGKTKWWWLVLAVGTVGLIVGAVWGYCAQKRSWSGITWNQLWVRGDSPRQIEREMRPWWLFGR
jgi:hypothetical protein